MQHLASHYADQLNVLAKDVLDRLEELRTTALRPDGSHSVRVLHVESFQPRTRIAFSIYGSHCSAHLLGVSF